MIIKKESLANAIRLFISLVLYREKEEDKDKKIKTNRKNIADYLNVKDLWDIQIYNDIKFKKSLDKIKSLNIKIKEILWLYYYLVDNKEEGFEDEVREYLEKIKEEEKKKIEERAKHEKEEINQKQGITPEKPRRQRLDTGQRGKRNRKNTDSDSD